MTLPPPAVPALLSLLPPHVLQRDAQAGGLLTDLLDAVGRQLNLVEADIEQLYDSWFIETCPEWVVPYIGDLVGVDQLPPDLRDTGADVSRRALVADTIAYRRRKGTAAVLEDVARAASGWPARAVEYFRLLAAATHVNHPRIDRPATASIRRAPSEGGLLDNSGTALAQGALDPLAHTADVRHIESFRGRYGIPHIGVFLFPDLVNEVAAAPARPPDPADPAAGWTVHPLGVGSPLYAPPEAESSIEHLATEADLPVPLRPRRLQAALVDARNGASSSLPVGVTVDGVALSADRVRVCRLEDLAPSAGPGSPPLPGPQVMIDPVLGIVHPYLDGAASEPDTIDVSYAYGTTGNIGAGTDDRSVSHQDLLDTDPFVADGNAPGATVVEQRTVPPSGAPTVHPNFHAPSTDLATALAELTTGTTEAGTYVAAVTDSGFYAGDLTIDVPERTRLVVVAAKWPAQQIPGVYDPRDVRPTVLGSLTVSGGAGSSFVLDGFVIDGDVTVENGQLASCSIGRCTIAGSVHVAANVADSFSLRLIRTLNGPLTVDAPAAAITVAGGAVLGGATWARGGSFSAAIMASQADLVIDESTVRGDLRTRSLSASSSILDGVATVDDRQVGCVRYSYVRPGSRVPRRFRCVPADDDGAPPVPTYASDSAGDPHFLALSRSCADAIAEGGEDGSEMGVHHRLQRPARRRAAQRMLAPYLPVGLDVGVAAPFAGGRS